MKYAQFAYYITSNRLSPVLTSRKVDFKQTYYYYGGVHYTTFISSSFTLFQLTRHRREV